MSKDLPIILHPTVVSTLMDWLEKSTLAIKSSDLLHRSAHFYGPGAVGKTEFVNWLRSELGWQLIDDEIMGMHIGQSHEKISEFFQSGRESFNKNLPIPILLHIDEAHRFEFETGNYNQEIVASLKEQAIGDNEGLILISSGNSRSWGDTAFSRRIGHSILFPLPGPTEIYRQIKQYFDEEDFADIDLVNLMWILFEHKFSYLHIDQLLFKLHRFQATLEESKISKQYIYQEVHKLSDHGYTNNLATSFWHEALEKYPDIEQFRDPDKDEEEIRQMIEKTRQSIEQHLSKLREEF